MLLLQQMIVLFIFMMIGYFAAVKGILDEKTCKNLSWIIVNVANPAMIISGSIGKSSIGVNKIIFILLLACALFALMIILSYIIAASFRVPEKQAGVYKVMLVFSNIGFMGFPLIKALYGAGALIYASPFMIVFNVLVYTWGIRAISGRSAGSGTDRNRWWKGIINIGVISCIISLIIALTGVKVPYIAATAIDSMSDATLPVSMLVIGASMRGMKLKDLVSDWKLLLFSALKLLVLPVIILLVLKLFIHDDILLGICMIMLATPAGSMTVMLSQQYDGDCELAAGGVVLTTLLSVITMPIVSAVINII